MVVTQEGEYWFATESGITYGVVFTSVGDLFSAYTHLYHLFFDFTIEVKAWGGNKTAFKDYRTGDTIALIVEKFLTANPDAALSYVCDSSDEKQYQRFLQFKRWFNQYNNVRLNMEIHHGTIEGDMEMVDENGGTIDKHQEIYGALIISASNSQRMALLTAYDLALQDFQGLKG